MFSMIDSNQPTEAITEWDLALFAENALVPSRHQQVANFLADHPELAALVGVEIAGSSGRHAAKTHANSESRVKRDHLTNSYLPDHSEYANGSWPHRLEDTDNTSIPVAEQSDAAKQSKSPPSIQLKRLLTTVNLLAASLIVCAGIGLFPKTQAASPVLSEIEQSFKDGTLSSESDGLLRARIELERIDPLLLSSEDQQLYQYLLAMVLLGQAESELLVNRPVIQNRTEPLTPSLAKLSQRAIDSLTELVPYKPELQPDLARAWALHGRIHLRFMVSHRGKRQVNPALICGAFLKSFGLMAEDDPERWRIASRLLKAFYKTSPQQFDQHSAELLADITRTFPEIQIETIRPRESVLMQLAEAIERQPPDTSPVRVAHVEVASVLTMASRSGLENSTLSRIIQDALNMAESGRERASDEFLLVYGQLLGNLADRERNLNLTQAIRYGRKAHEVLRQLVENNRSEEVLGELAWVTARLLIAEYRYSQLHTDEPTGVLELVGALRQTENNLKHFEALQLMPWEIDVIKAIEAEVSVHPSRASGAKRILESYRANELALSDAELICKEFSHLQAFRNSADFLAFRRLVANGP